MSREIPKDQRKQIKNELEALLNTYNPSGDQESVIDQQLAVIQQNPPIDFDEMNAKFKRQANNLTSSLIKYYVDAGLIEREDYHRFKKELDDSSLENILFQIKSLRMAIERIMEDINQGNTHPRLYEVFGQLHDKLANVVKIQANYILFLEDTYRRVKAEIVSSKTDGNVTEMGLHQKGDYYVTAGTKNIMKSVEVEAVEVEDARYLTNPNQKSAVLTEIGLAHLIEKKEESQEITSGDIDNLI